MGRRRRRKLVTVVLRGVEEGLAETEGRSRWRWKKEEGGGPGVAGW